MCIEKESVSIGDTKDCDSILNQTLNGTFEKLLKSNPDLLNHIAVKDADREDTKITFDELNKKSNRLARCLVAHFGDRIVGTSHLLYK